MQKNKKQKIVSGISQITKHALLAFFAALLLSTLPGIHQAVVRATGVTPPIMYVDDVISNVPIRRVFNVTRIDTSRDELIILTTRGEAGKLIRFPEGNTFIFPKGESYKEVSFTILADNVPTGKYTAYVRANQTQAPPGFLAVGRRSRISLSQKLADAGGGAGAFNLSGAEVDVHLNITNKLIEKWEAKDVDLSTAEEDTPIDFDFIFDNQGGTKARPDKVKLIIEDQKGKGFKYEEEISGDKFDFADPFTKKPMSVFTNARLKVGKYYAYIYVYDKGGVLKYSKEKIPLEIVPQGSLEQAAIFKQLRVDRPEDEIPPTYAPGDVSTIRGIISNNGKVGFRTTFVVEMYKEGKKIDLLKSNEAYVPFGRDGDFEVNYKFVDEGQYQIKAYFPFGISKTEVKSLDILVSKVAPGSTPSPKQEFERLLTKASLGNFSFMPLLGAGIVLLILLVIFFWKSKPAYPIGALCLFERKALPLQVCPWWCPLPRGTSKEIPSAIPDKK